MRLNHVREKLRSGQPSIGCFLGLGSPNVAELLAHQGFEWLVVETEHNALDVASVEHMLMAMSGADTIPLVRIPSAEQVYIQRALDIGGMGVVVPMVKTAAEAEAIVAATRFPPQGKRSFGPLRASRYTLDNAEYLEKANDNILVVLILETREGVENLEAIMSVPGVDAIYIGPFDLCLSLGLNPINQPYPEVDAVIERALALGRKTGVAVGYGASSPDHLRQLRADGFTMLGYATDYHMMVAAARAGLEAFRDQG